jgi:copper transport protein
LKNILFLVLLLVGLGSWKNPAVAHASLNSADPADGAVLARAPTEFTLIFSEPISPLLLRLLGPDGRITRLTQYQVRGETLVLTLPSWIKPGTSILNWRVTSQDGHPIGGSITFSVGNEGGTASVGIEELSRIPVWAARSCMLAFLIAAVGAAVFHTWIWPLAPKVRKPFIGATVLCGCIAATGSTALEVIDAVGGSFSDLQNVTLWFGTVVRTFGVTLLLSMLALSLAAMAGKMNKYVGRTCSLLAAASCCTAFVLTGHASTATPQLVMQPTAFLHVASVLFWIGSLIPLRSVLRNSAGPAALARFSRPITLTVLLLVGTGLILGVAELGEVNELWNSAYGLVLSAKLLFLLPLFGLAALNRFILTPRIVAGWQDGVCWMKRSITGELLIALVIIGIVVLWHFTPPPRSMSAVTIRADGIQFHAHGLRAMANITVKPAHVGPVEITLNILDAESRPLEVKDVDLELLAPVDGSEPLRRPAHRLTQSTWQVDRMTIPFPGIWTFRIDLLVSEFEKVPLKAILNVPAN